MKHALSSRRADARARLDGEPDWVATDGNVSFRQSFEAIEDEETFFRAPTDVVDAG